MFRCSQLLIAAGLIFMLAQSACGQSTKGQVALESRGLGSSSVEETAQAEHDEVIVPSNHTSLAPIQAPPRTAEVVRILTPSVVQIVAETWGAGSPNQILISQGAGTGIILDQQGHILTNNHLIAGAQRITVILSNGVSLPAQVVGGDATTDTAVIRIEAPGLQPAALGLSSNLEVGQGVIAIGHALGMPGEPSVSMGVVSALGRPIQSNAQTAMVDMIQTDAAINPGNSGGPLVNSEGEVIGIITGIIESRRGVGLAIPISDANIVVAQLIENRYATRSPLGYSPVNP